MRRRSAFALLVVVALLTTTTRGAEPSPSLPRPTDSWIRIDAPDFVVFSDASEAEARRLAANLERFRAALAFLTRGVRFSSPVPTYVYVFKGDRSFEAYRPDPDVRGYFAARIDGNYIAVNALPPIQPSARDDQEHAHYYWGTVYHEYVHYVLNSNFANVPFWLHEGLAGYYYTFRVAGDRLEIGRVRRPYVRLLRESTRRWIPVEELVTGHRDPRHDESLGTAYAESWALVHLLLSQGRQAALAEYLASVDRGDSLSGAFRGAFGPDLEKLDRQLRAYVRQGHFRFARVEVSALDVPEVPEGVAIDRSEVLYRLGRLLFASSGKPERAEAHFREALREDPGHAGAHLGLAVVMESTGRADEAEVEFDRALRLDDANAVAHLYYGVHLLDRVSEATEDEGTKLVERARDEFRRCAELDPDFVEPFYLYGLTYLYGAGKAADGLDALRHAFKGLPSRMDVALGLVLLHLRADDPEGARRVVRDVVSRCGPSFACHLRSGRTQSLVAPIDPGFMVLNVVADMVRDVLPSVADPEYRAEIESCLRESLPSPEEPSEVPAPARQTEVPEKAEKTEEASHGPFLGGIEGVTMPKIVKHVPPVYPPKARSGVQGKVFLQAVVSADGSVRDVKVLRCNRRGFGFEEAAMKAVRRWRYEPATKAGVPVDVYISVVVDFTLEH